MADDNAKKVQDKFIKALTESGNTAKQAEERAKAFMPKIKGSEKEFLNLIEAERTLQLAAADAAAGKNLAAAATALKKRDEVKKTLKDKLEKNKTKGSDIKEVLLYGEVLGVVEAEKSAPKKDGPSVKSEQSFMDILARLQAKGDAIVAAPTRLETSIPQLQGKNPSRYT